MAKQNSWYDYELDSFEKYFQACKYTILTVIIQIFDLVFVCVSAVCTICEEGSKNRFISFA